MSNTGSLVREATDNNLAFIIIIEINDYVFSMVRNSLAKANTDAKHFAAFLAMKSAHVYVVLGGTTDPKWDGTITSVPVGAFDSESPATQPH